MILGAGAFWAYKNYKTETPQAVTEAPAKIDLVNSVTNLSDEQGDEGLKERVSQAIKAHKQNINPDLGSYKGLYAKCFMEGHDIHWIDENGTITNHVETNSPLTGNDNIARQLIYESGAGFVVVIYQNGYEAYGMDGNLVKSSH